MFLQTLLVAVAGLLQFSFAEFPTENNVLVLNDDLFSQALQAHELLLVEFYAPWCGHCKKLAPEWDHAATTLINENALAKLAKVDTVEASNVYKKYEISSFPTILFFKNGRSVPYKGARTAEAIVSWVRKHSLSPVTTLDSIDSLIEAKKSFDVVVLGYFPDTSTVMMQNKRDAFFQLAESMEHLNFFETDEESLAVYINLLDEDYIDKAHIFILKSFDQHLISEQPLQLDKKLVTERSMGEYVKQHSYEFFPEFSRESAKRIFAPRIMNHGWVITDPDSVDYEETLKHVYFLANQFKGRVQFINLPKYNEAYLKQFDVDINALPALFLVDVKTMDQYPYKGPFEWAALGDFTSRMLNGTLPKYRKSEAVMPEDTLGSVKILRASSFDGLVQNTDKTAFVFFYASWCGHCEKFSPTFDEVGEKFQSDDEVVIAKIDAIENDVDGIMDGIVVESFPTLYCVTGEKGNRKAVLYEGSNLLEDMVEYITNNRKVSGHSSVENSAEL